MTTLPARRSLTADELQVWRDFIETTEAVRTELGRRLQSESNLSPGDYAVLLALTEAPARRLRSSDLAVAIGWERSRLSLHLGRMERRGLIRREDCATDSRGAEVVLEDTGATAFRRASAPHLRAVQQLFVEALTPEQLAVVGEISRALRTRLVGSERTA
jgi:DNA-binding MarR family transcriptional regulator